MEQQIEALYFAYENNLNIELLVTENEKTMKEIRIEKKIEINDNKTQFLGQNSAGNRVCFELTRNNDNISLKVTRGPTKVKNSQIKQLCIE